MEGLEGSLLDSVDVLPGKAGKSNGEVAFGCLSTPVTSKASSNPVMSLDMPIVYSIEEIE
jgi:hypothetical protein